VHRGLLGWFGEGTHNIAPLYEDIARPACELREHALVELSELEARANAKLDPGAAAYIRRGAGDDATLAANAAAWKRLALHPHVLLDVGAVHTATRMLGVGVAAPLFVAPTAMHQLATAEGERATARAAAASGVLMMVSMAASLTIDEIAAAAPDAPRFAQLYVLADRGRTRAMVEAAVAAGCHAVVVAVDGAAVPYGRDRVALPPHVAALVDDFDASVTIDDLAALIEWSAVPVVVKGVLRGDDALRCVEAGASAVYVSNHGGRIVDGCVDTATALVEVVAAVGARTEVYVDGGIRSGVDVLRALALGASAVGLGRTVLWGLAIHGEDGACEVLDTMRAELARAMAFCGTPALDAITPDLVRA
jgi:4-hydroxymandelate oxidase